MNKITYKPTNHYEKFERLATGTIFHYPSTTKLYMKVAKDNRTAYALSLTNGDLYDVIADKEVCTVPMNTILTFTANESCPSC